MNIDLATPAGWLPLVFVFLMAVSMLAYVILDGYDLGVGILLRRAPDAEKDVMVSAIGPFWDANETWLVLGVGILLVAFPLAHGVILGALYLPVLLMLIGLSLRGVAFEMRAKVQRDRKELWNRLFYLGSVLAAFAQGLMLGLYVLGLRNGILDWLFAILVGCCLVAGYALLGASFLIIKASGTLQKKAIKWARGSLGLTAAGIGAVSLATPMLSTQIFQKWFSLTNFISLAPIPLITAVLFFVVWRSLSKLEDDGARSQWLPFAASAGIFALAFYGLAYSLFPYLVADRIDIWQAASAPESLMIILVGVAVVLPTIIGYTIFAYRVFWGKATPLRYY